MTGKPGRSGGRRSNQTGRPPTKNGKRRDLYLSDEVYNWLRASGNASETIEQIAREKMDTEKKQKCRELAEKIYNKVSGADNRREHADLTGRIYDWLYEGDADTVNVPLEQLVTEWIAYDEPQDEE